MYWSVYHYKMLLLLTNSLLKFTMEKILTRGLVLAKHKFNSTGYYNGILPHGE